jgi:hypothetical protein
MANPEHVEIVRQGAAAIAQWRRQKPEAPLSLSEADLTEANLRGANLAWAELAGAVLAEADLTGADLRLANLTGADLRLANLTGADLRLADLTGADLTGADLRRANLAGANLAGANLAGANLTGANLTGANLAEANLRGAALHTADLSGANLTGVRFGFTWLSDCNLSQAIGLSTVNHEGPSSIGVDTLIASFRGAGNKLTSDLETFFLGAGVPKELLAALPRIVGEVEYYTCFISYGQPDLDFATRR